MGLRDKVGILFLIFFPFFGSRLGAEVLTPAEHQAISEAELKKDIDFLASDDMMGRFPGSPGAEAAREFLTQWFKEQGALDVRAAGSTAAFGDFIHPFYPQNPAGAAPSGYNLMGLFVPKGSAAAASGKAKIIISAHYDHVAGCRDSWLALSAVCNGAADNAAAVVAVMQATEAVLGAIESPVLVVFWDDEENNMNGSRSFLSSAANRDLVKDAKLLINLDIIGLEIFSTMKMNHFLIGAETGGPALLADLGQVLAGSPLEVNYLSYALGQLRSDHWNFFGKVDVPAVFFSDGDGSVYHSTADEPHRINLAKVAAVARAVAGTVKVASSPTKSYTYVKPRTVPLVGVVRPRLPADAKVIRGIIDGLIENSEENCLFDSDIEFLSGLQVPVDVDNSSGDLSTVFAESNFLLQTVPAVTDLSKDIAERCLATRLD